MDGNKYRRGELNQPYMALFVNNVTQFYSFSIVFSLGSSRLGCDSILLEEWFPAFQRTLRPPASSVKHFKLYDCRPCQTCLK